VESTKSVSDIYSPVDGEVTEINEEIDEDPGLVNADPYGAGWAVQGRAGQRRRTAGRNALRGRLPGADERSRLVPGAAASGPGRYNAATAHLEPPLAIVDLAALRRNAAAMAARAGGKPIRLASKSVRCRAILRLALACPGSAA
jgi:hypothetical protein